MAATGQTGIDDGIGTGHEIDLPGVGALDPARVRLRYDRESDTLAVHFYGVGRPGVSIVMKNGWYVRWNRERTLLIGLQIEGFMARVIAEEPGLLGALDVAELRGITREEVARLRQTVVPARYGQTGAEVERLLPLLWSKATGNGELPVRG